jgi:hypothetical protein
VAERKVDVNPDVPPLAFAFRIRAQVGVALRAGAGRLGERTHVPIAGGTVDGPRLQGRIVPGGSDWILGRRDGASIIDAHYTIVADDGTPIYVHNRGLRVSSAEVLERLRRGDAVAPHEFYFRSTPVFDAPDGPHAWLSDHVFVASLARDGADVLVDVFQVH